VKAILAIDQGTTSTRAIAFSLNGKKLFSSQLEFKQYFPKNGWVEHNPNEIWLKTLKVIKNVSGKCKRKKIKIVTIGITNQRETTVLWDKTNGKPVYNAIVWQDRRTEDFCNRLKINNKESIIRKKTGLFLDPYFSATKVRWIIKNVPKAKKLIKELRSIFEKNKIHFILAENNKKMLDANFWQNKSLAQKVIKEKKLHENLINSYEDSIKKLTELNDLYQLAKDENNKSIINETLQNVEDLKLKTKKNETKCFLSNESDSLDCYIEIHAGAGGTESQDWAEMLRRMYMKWAANKEFKSQIVHEHKGDEAGIKSSTIKIEGDYIYGWLKSESGIHRLVRISPFDSGARRHTSFASVWIYPLVDENIDIEILEKDLRIDTYRSSGAGGQHVNTTDSAVRITHIPTKIVVQCQNERSQHKNKETCFNMLKARLYEHELKKKNENVKSLEDSKTDIGWGHQIRSYVLQPYRLVKDLRNNYENTNPDSVLNGDIDEFLENSLFRSRGKNK